MDCIFCSIVDDPSKANVIYQDDDYLVFEDVNPKASTHWLIIPKKHIKNFHEIQDTDNKKLVKGLYDIAWELIDENDLDGCQLRINSGRKYGQEIDHIHLHLMSGDKPNQKV